VRSSLGYLNRKPENAMCYSVYGSRCIVSNKTPVPHVGTAAELVDCVVRVAVVVKFYEGVSVLERHLADFSVFLEQLLEVSLSGAVGQPADVHAGGHDGREQGQQLRKLLARKMKWSGKLRRSSFWGIPNSAGTNHRFGLAESESNPNLNLKAFFFAGERKDSNLYPWDSNIFWDLFKNFLHFRFKCAVWM
jgi:hypothetical protein